MLSDPADLRTALARIRFRGHDALLVRITDQRERDFDMQDELTLQGLEGEGDIKVDPRLIRDAYLAALAEHERQVDSAVKGAGLDILSLSTHDWLGPPLAGFLAARQARLKRTT
jgi:hypothetical protein